MNRLTVFAGFTALLLSPLVSAPAATAYSLLWGESQLSQRKERYQRGQGRIIWGKPYSLTPLMQWQLEELIRSDQHIWDTRNQAQAGKLPRLADYADIELFWLDHLLQLCPMVV